MLSLYRRVSWGASTEIFCVDVAKWYLLSLTPWKEFNKEK